MLSPAHNQTSKMKKKKKERNIKWWSEESILLHLGKINEQNAASSNATNYIHIQHTPYRHFALSLPLSFSCVSS